MSFFYTNTTSTTKSSDGPQIRKLTEDEKKVHLAPLAYIVPGYHALARTGNRVPRFPTPAQAAQTNKIYSMVKTYDRTKIVSTSGIATGGAFNFDLNSINDSGSLVAVFDQYRIALVEVTFTPDTTQITSGSSPPPLFYSTVDLDDSTSITAAQIEDYAGAMVTDPVKIHKHVFVPQVALAAYSGTFTSYSMVKAPWIDVASPAVQHYGVKYAWGTATALSGYYPKVRMIIEFRQTR